MQIWKYLQRVLRQDCKVIRILNLGSIKTRRRTNLTCRPLDTRTASSYKS